MSEESQLISSYLQKSQRAGGVWRRQDKDIEMLQLQWYGLQVSLAEMREIPDDLRQEKLGERDLRV